jgi:hypothetical protein
MPTTVQPSLDFEVRDRARDAARAALERLPVGEAARKFLCGLHSLDVDGAGIMCPLVRICRAAGISEAAGRQAVTELAGGDPAFLSLKIDPGRANVYAINWQEVFSA